ncbi:MAG TPA: ABC-F family ATP-binding cassette domain-containing protein [Microthrixaceae bacterium]|nr:ABC-F family ATP-binding cassette domain-containing protein [Microthrixaceae bacterium]
MPSAPSRSTSSSATATLLVRGLTVERAGATVLADIDLTVASGDRIGVVGPNGSGKSTLLAALAGEIAPRSGTVSRTPPGASVGLLRQEPMTTDDATVREMLARRTGVTAAQGELDAATRALADGSPGADDRYALALERWLAIGAADLDARIGETWHELGLAPRLLDADPSRLSGGEAARSALAALLLSRFDVLLLDEPTNDLDLDGLDRLLDFVLGTTAPMVLVSHDRWFLDRTVTDVVELHEEHHTAIRYGGGWAAYLDERATAARHAAEAFDTYQQQRQSLKARAQQQREWSVTGERKAARNPKDNDKFVRRWSMESSERLASKAKATERAMERLSPVDKPWEGWRLHLSVARVERSGDDVARLSAGVVERGSFRLGPIDVEISWAERVAIVGPNGSGKSTLLAALLGRLPLVSGSQWLGPGVVIGELDQARRQFLDGRPLIDGVMEATALRASEARSLLAKFGLGADHVERRADELSPGERTRVSLAVLMSNGSNLLVLDEPTNHLDLPAIEQLESALATWDGTMLLVTHDRRFLEAVHVDRTIDLTADGS